MMNAFKKAGAANANNKIYQFWQQDNHPIELTTNKMMDERLNYTHNNPVEAGFTDKPEEYLYSSARDYTGVKGMAHTPIKQEKSSANEIVIYPNPADKQLYITGLGDEIASIQIYDMQCKIVISKNRVIDNSSLLIEHLSNGIYRLNISTNFGNHYQIKFSVLK
ncbi:MAG: T9SS type A sorting domain-containing protein [Bacteroidia bacterium]